MREMCVCVCDLRTVGSFNSCFCCKNITCPASLSLSFSRTSYSSRITSCESSMCVSVWVYVTVICHHPLSLAYCISVFSVYIFIANVAPKSRQAVRQRERERRRVSETGGYSKLFRICLCYIVAHYASSGKVYCVLLRVSSVLPFVAVPLPLPSAAVLLPPSAAAVSTSF